MADFAVEAEVEGIGTTTEAVVYCRRSEIILALEAALASENGRGSPGMIEIVNVTLISAGGTMT